MVSGGNRKGAGRKKKFTFFQKLALANEVTLLQQKNPKLTVSKALKQLTDEGLILPQTRARYLTPKYFREDILIILKEGERKGIATGLPRLSRDNPL